MWDKQTVTKQKTEFTTKIITNKTPRYRRTRATIDIVQTISKHKNCKYTQIFSRHKNNNKLDINTSNKPNLKYNKYHGKHNFWLNNTKHYNKKLFTLLNKHQNHHNTLPIQHSLKHAKPQKYKKHKNTQNDLIQLSTPDHQSS